MTTPKRTVEPVFATAAFCQSQMVAGELKRVPTSEVHAKTLGTSTTLCGKSSHTWTKFWTMPFVGVRASQCGECVAALQHGVG